jgi:hypothetical protein
MFVGNSFFLFFSFSEQFGNTSPGICVQHIFRYFHLFYPTIHVIFFDRSDLNTLFSSWMKEVAKEVIMISSENLYSSQQQILSSSIDILLYLALPTDKMTYFLAHQRLAPIQMVTGFGHPLSSGMRSIDYTIIPEIMIPGTLSTVEDNAIETVEQRNSLEIEQSKKRRRGYSNQEKDSISCAFEAYSCPSDIIEQYKTEITEKEKSSSTIPSLIRKEPISSSLNPNETSSLSIFERCEISKECYKRSDPSSFYYTEQVIRFSSLGHYIENPLNYYINSFPFAEELLKKFQFYRNLEKSAFYSLLKQQLQQQQEEKRQNLNNNGATTKREERSALQHHYFNISYDQLLISFQQQQLPSSSSTTEVRMNYTLSCEEINYILYQMNPSTSNDEAPLKLPIYLQEDVHISDETWREEIKLVNGRFSGRSSSSSEGSVYPLITAEKLGCYSHQEQRLYHRQYHYYNVIQHLKKYHPLFDRVFISLILLDPFHTRFIVKDSMKYLLPRIWKRFNSLTKEERNEILEVKYKNKKSDDDQESLEEIRNGQRNGLSSTSFHYLTFKEFSKYFIFVPSTLNHYHYLVLLSLSSVFLNIFPFGSGITSFEAIMMNIPMISLFEETSILQFAKAQLAEMFPISGRNGFSDSTSEEENVNEVEVQKSLGQFHQLLLSNIFIASDLEDYVKKSLSVVNSDFISYNYLKDYISKQKENLLHESIVIESIQEWGQLFLRAVS